MDRDFRLSESDMISKDHFPVIAALDMIGNDRFIRTLEGISRGYGFGENYGACVFPNDQDEYDIETMGKLDGVEFGLHNGEAVVLDYDTVYYYLKKACDIYVEDFPKDRAVVDKLLAKFRALYNIQDYPRMI